MMFQQGAEAGGWGVSIWTRRMHGGFMRLWKRVCVGVRRRGAACVQLCDTVPREAWHRL